MIKSSEWFVISCECRLVRVCFVINKTNHIVQEHIIKGNAQMAAMSMAIINLKRKIQYAAQIKRKNTIGCRINSIEYGVCTHIKRSKNIFPLCD